MNLQYLLKKYLYICEPTQFKPCFSTSTVHISNNFFTKKELCLVTEANSGRLVSRIKIEEKETCENKRNNQEESGFGGWLD